MSSITAGVILLALYFLMAREGSDNTGAALHEAWFRERPLARVSMGPNNRAAGHFLVPEARVPSGVRSSQEQACCEKKVPATRLRLVALLSPGKFAASGSYLLRPIEQF